MVEYKVGDTLQAGPFKLKVMESSGMCKAGDNQCAFFFCDANGCNSHDLILGHCKGEFREDRTDVIFVEV